MLLRVAAWWCAAFLFAVAVPAFAGIETGPVADANQSAASITAATPMGQAAVVSDTPSAAPQDPIKAKVDAQSEILPADPVTPVEATTLADIAVKTQPDVQKPDQAAATAPAKLAALESATPVGRNAALPRNDLPSSDLPHIDASFRFNILPVKDGDVLTKWNRVKTDMRAENEVFARCRANMDSCPVAAKNFLDHRRPGPRADRARPHRRDQSRHQHGDRADERHGAMGRARQVERAARDVHDAQGRLRGLCHRQICRADRSRHCRRRRETHDRAQHRRHEDHAVTAVRLDGAWIILDNRWLRLVEDKAMPDAVPLFALGSEGVRQFLPDVLVGAQRSPAPASITR